MNDLRKAAEMALEALELSHPSFGLATEKFVQAIKTLRQALAQPDEVLAEREACAKVCETFYNHEAKDCAEAIRARGER